MSHTTTHHVQRGYITITGWLWIGCAVLGALFLIRSASFVVALMERFSAY